MKVFVLHSRENGFHLLEDQLEKFHLPFGNKLPTGDPGSAGTVILWGKHLQEPQGRPVLNRLACVLRAFHGGTVKEMLELNGIKCFAESKKEMAKGKRQKLFTREFRVPVFQQDALALYERKREGVTVTAGEYSAIFVESRVTLPLDASSLPPAGSPYFEIPRRGATFHGRRAMREAVKAVYALGLDFALVTIGITPGAQTAVLQVDPVPALDEELARLFAEAFARFAAEDRQEREASDGSGKRDESAADEKQADALSSGKSPVVLGADPEFILVRSNGKVVSASRFMERGGPVGCDGVVLPERQVIQPLVELRPQPSPDPRRLVSRLRRCMLQAAALIRDPSLAWVAGGMPVPGLPLGGHIHFSGVALNSGLLRALDGYLALPAALLERAEDRKRRPRYGALGDCRRKPHGGFEYRTLSSWLATPRLAAGVLSLAALVAANYRRLTRLPLLHTDMQRLFYAGGRERLQHAVRELWGELEALPDYAVYRKELDALKADLFQREPPASGKDFRSAWNIDFPAVPANADEIKFHLSAAVPPSTVFRPLR